MANTNSVIQYPGVYETAGRVSSPSGGQVVFVGSGAQLGALGQVGEAIASRSFTSVNQALSQCVTARGDWIYLLPGYTESITVDAWSNLAATDVTVCGLGHGTNRPALTWTLSTSTMLFDTANFRLLNCQLFLAGANAAGAALTVAAPITISAAGCEISDCDIYWGFDADQIVTIGITTTAGADNLTFNRNFCYAETAAAPMTTFLRLVGVTDPIVTNNDIICGTTSAAVGPIQELTTACTGINISGNYVQNNAASSTGCITVALAASTGWIASNFCRNMTDGSNAQIVVTSGDVQLFQNYGVNNSNETGILLGTPSA